MLDHKLHQLNTLVLTDAPEGQKPDALYIYAEPDSHLELLTEIAIAAASPKLHLKIALCGGIGQGYDFRRWIKRLREKGIREEDIILIAPPQAGETLNTRSESIKLAEQMRMFSWKTVWITAPPYQQLRAFLTLLAALKNQPHYAKIYNIPALPINWYKEIVHYQGEVKGRPVDFINSELERIEKYTALGHLATVEEALKYLEERENS